MICHQKHIDNCRAFCKKHGLSFPNTTNIPNNDLRVLKSYAKEVGTAFTSKLIAADFVKLTNGQWYFLEAGPGSAAGTAHEGVFKAVANRLMGHSSTWEKSAVGGLF